MTRGQEEELKRLDEISVAWKHGFAAGCEAAARLVESAGDQAACDHAADIRTLLALAPSEHGGGDRARCTCGAEEASEGEHAPFCAKLAGQAPGGERR